MQQGVQMDTTHNIQQCWEWLANNVASIAQGLRKEFIDPKTVWDTNMDATLLFWDTNMVEVTSHKKAYAKVLLKRF